jgi:3'-phosphoadenosine 5'-phosphosulfate sulfotransferase (PAPS reductase)/FAD synthetase
MQISTTPDDSGILAFQEALPELLKGHQRVVMQHSGGRDSIAVYRLLEPVLDRLAVIWLNSGDLFPEVVEYMGRVKARTPYFKEIRSNTQESIRKSGWPVDVLPIDYTDFGQRCTERKPIRLRSYLECCMENISLPMHEFVTSSRVTLVIRGNRKVESHRTPAGNGAVVEGVQYVYPIWDWSDDDVVDYLRRVGEEITPRLTMGHSSLDCMSCTAFTNHSLPRMKYIKEYHPLVFSRLKGVFNQIEDATTRESSGLKEILSM